MAKDNKTSVPATTSTSQKAMALIQGAVPEDLVKSAQEMAGQGVSMAAEDTLIPILAVLQPLSPQVTKGDAKRIEGAEAGHLLLTATGQLFAGETGLLFQPTNLTKAVVEWIVRDQGGGGGQGFVAAHAEMPKDAIEVANPQKPDGRKIWMTPDKKHVFIDTRYHYGHIIDPDTGQLMQAVIPFSSTGHTVSRAWNTLMKSQRVPDGMGGTVIAPSWFQAYRLTTVRKQNASGTWYVIKAEAAGWLNQALREQGKLLHDSVLAGDKTAAQPDDADTDELPENDNI